MKGKLTRRKFIRNAAITASATPIISPLISSCSNLSNYANSRLNHAAIGVGGMGDADLAQIASHPDVSITAICDVDRNNLGKASEKYPHARTYTDWRELLTKEYRNIQSINVTTPDHMHALIAYKAMELGLHVYCQKPLTHTVIEARRLKKLAIQKKIVTQMGIQNHTGKNYSTAKVVFDKGDIKDINEVHVWTDRPAGWWPQGEGRPEGQDPIPESLDWDKWIGVAPKRPYKNNIYHAFAWRGRLDFGTGAQGDMACHLMDPAIWFLDLGQPLTIKSTGPTPTKDCFPLWSRVEYEFEGTKKTSKEGVKVVWHDGGKRPDSLLEKHGFGENPYTNGSLFVGSNGAYMISPYEPIQTTLNGVLQETELPELKTVNHWHQWVDACFGRTKTSAPFNYAAHLTEIALLGNIALFFKDEKLEWDNKRMGFKNMLAANKLLHKPYREGWSFNGLI